MITTKKTHAGQAGRRLAISLLVVNLVVMLFPPVHLSMAKGDMAWALAYFIGSPLVSIASLFILLFCDRTDAGEVSL